MTSISPRLEVKVRKSVESIASYEAEMGINAGILGPGPLGSWSAIGVITIDESLMLDNDSLTSALAEMAPRAAMQKIINLVK